MIKQFIILVFWMMVALNFIFAQNIPWSAIKPESTNLAYLNIGYDYGLTTQVGYGHKVSTSRPLWLTLDFSVPMGKDLFDDFKVRFGGQMAVFEISDFKFTTQLYGIFRRHETELVRMANFGAELSGMIGYYRPKWYIAAELGFDKSIPTHLKHSELMKEFYPDIIDGWFIPSGGHWFFGGQIGKTIGHNYLITLRLGATDAEGEDEDALIPLYGQLGLGRTF